MLIDIQFLFGEIEMRVISTLINIQNLFVLINIQNMVSIEIGFLSTLIEIGVISALIEIGVVSMLINQSHINVDRRVISALINIHPKYIRGNRNESSISIDRYPNSISRNRIWSPIGV